MEAPFFLFSLFPPIPEAEVQNIFIIHHFTFRHGWMIMGGSLAILSVISGTNQKVETSASHTIHPQV